MPKRVIDFDAMWASDKIAACAEWAQAEYAWLYGLADCAGCFELTNLRVIWGRVAAIRRNFSIERLEQVLDEFHDKRLLFIWSENGKRYGHWTGSDVPGRLPPPSWRNRLERLAPPVPREQLEEFLSVNTEEKTAARMAALRTPFRAGPCSAGILPANLAVEEPFASGGDPPPLKPHLEPAPAQGLNLGLDLEGKWSEKTHTPCVAGRECVESRPQTEKQNGADKSKPLFSEEETKRFLLEKDSRANSAANPNSNSNSDANSNSNSESNTPPLQTGAGYRDKFGTNGTSAPQALAEIWDQERRSLPEMRGLTPERLARCRERIANALKNARHDPGRKDGAQMSSGTDGETRKPGVNSPDLQATRFLADFREAVRRAAATPFLCGAGPAGWRANFDWIVANDTNYLKVLEGRYDSGAPNGAVARAASATANCSDPSRAQESARADWSAHASARDEAARRMAHAGTALTAHPSVRVRANVLDRAQHRA